MNILYFVSLILVIELFTYVILAPSGLMMQQFGE